MELDSSKQNNVPGMQVETPQARCRVGLAQVDVTPPVGIYHRMWGAAMHDRAESVHRPLLATLLWMEAEDPAPKSRHLLVTLDHCVLDGNEMLKLRQSVAEAARVAVHEVSLTLSHTHGSGWMSRNRSELPGGELIGPYLDHLAEALGDLARAAGNTLAPATITYGQGRCTLAAHRDLWDEASERFVCGFNPTGPADDTVVIARITDEADAVRCVLVNYACHPTTLAWDNRALSPDWIGAMRETVESLTGGLCLFVQGASGDLGPRDGFVGDPLVADRNGRQLGYAVLSALESLPPANTRFVYAGPVVSGTWIGTWRHEPLDPESSAHKQVFQWQHHMIELLYRAELPAMEETLCELTKLRAEEAQAHESGNRSLERDCHARVEQLTRQRTRISSLPLGKTYPLPVTLGRVGDALIVLVPAELYQAFQVTIRQRFAPRPVIVGTLTNDWQPGYMPAASSYGYGIYQDVIAAVAPGSLEVFTESVTRLIHAMLRGDDDGKE